MRRTLAAAQIAVSLVLLSDAGLLIESLRRMTETAPGINTEQVVTAGITVGPPRYANGSLRQQYFDSLVTRLRANPLVTAAAISDTVPPAGFMHNHPFSGLHVAGRAPGEPGLGGVVWRRTVSPGYFEAVGTPILRGRAFRQEDLASRQNMMVLSATLARRLFGAEDPVGKMIGIPLRGSPNAVVLGVAADVENAGVPGRSEPEYYLLRRPVPANASVAANPPAPPKGNDALLGGEASLIARALHAYDGEAYVIVRSPARTGAVAGWIRTEAAALDPTVPVTIAAMRERVRELSARPRFNAFLLGLFATVGMLLAAFGLYGLIGFLVAQRTQEIGVRMAMGATPATVAALVVRDGLRWTVAGAAAGIAGAAVTARALRGILFGVQPENPAIFGAAALVLMTAAVLAMLVPSLRAARIDPVVALRAD